ncbi:MAG: hypothetical protein VB055_07050 [Oscillospiraceae bacterium]|nr:hypothetical protein [Oscillospiraceae bacterium]
MEISSTTKLVIIAVFILYTIGMLAIGWVYKRKLEKKSKEQYTENFYTGGRAMGALLVAMMVAAGICSAGTFVGSPGSIYKVGLSWGAVVPGQMLMNLMVLGVVGKKIAIVSRRGNLQSFVGLLYNRYNNNKFLAVAAAIILLVFVGCYTSSQFIGGGRLFEVMTGLPYWVGLAAFTVVVMVVAAFSGLHGVAAATVLQGCIMTLACFLLLFLGFGYCGGEAAFHAIAKQNPDLVSGSAVYSPLMMLSLFMMFGFFNPGYPHAVIGCMTYNNTRAMNTAIKIGIVLVAFWSISLSLLAGVIRNVFPDLAVSDYALPTLAVMALPSWVAGLTLAGVVGALQSTVGTMVIVMSASVVKDVYQTMIKPDASPTTMKRMTNVVTIVIMLVIFVLALTPPDNLQDVVVYAVGGMISAFYIPLMLGIYWMRANEWGALAGMIGGLATYLVNAAGIVNWKLGMNSIIIGTLVSLILTVLVSRLTPKTPYGIINLWFGRMPKQRA